MSGVFETIKRLCGDGVEFRRLGDIARIKNGKDHKGLNDGEFPVYGSGGIMRYVDSYVYNKPSVLIPRKGSLNNIFYVDVPFWNVDTIFYTETDDTQVNTKYLYYFLSTVGLGNMNQAGGVPSQTQAVLKELKIAVPPLEVQLEIVKVLDVFIKLEAELEAELEARRKQYEYYRDMLLTFDDRTDSESKQAIIMALGDVGCFVRGTGIQKSDFREKGVGCIHYGQVHTHYGTWADETKSFVDSEFAQRLRKAQKGDLVIATTSEDDDAVAKAVAWLGEEDVVVSTDAYIFRHSLNPKYVSYFFQTEQFHKQKRPYITGTKVRRISGENLAKIFIPVPAREEQDRIVAILDKFDVLTNSIAEGLPREIELRRKQYEYYRDKLLSFVPLEKTE